MRQVQRRFFNAYGNLAARQDLQFLLHLGDSIYEAANTPPAGQTPGADIGRPFEPLHECKTLADYRCRYNQYRRDADVQAMHAALPLVASVDDHEFADGAWRGGADEHQDERDGPWNDRVNAALQARSEWLPIRPVDPADPWSVYLVVLSGDIHVSMALELRRDPYDLSSEPIAVEFVNTSITAQNFDDKMNGRPAPNRWPMSRS